MPLPADSRIAFVTGGLNLGGSTTFLLNLCGDFRRRNVSFKVFSFDGHHPLKNAFDFFSVHVATEDSNKTIFEDRIASIVNQLRHFQPTHVIACLGPDSFEVLRYIPFGIKRWAMIQSDDPRVYDTLGRYARWVDKVIGVSKQITKNCSSYPLLTSIPSCYLPYGVSIPECVPRQLPSSLQSTSTIRILYLGRLEQEQKRVRLFPEIYKRLIKNGTDFTWTIAGSGPERNFLADAMPSASGHEIYFTGAVDYRDISLLLNRNDVLILTSDYEGLPLSLLEAMGHGLVPVVSNLHSGIPEIVDTQSGVLVDPSDTEGYADGISRLARDPALLSSLSVSARDRVLKNFSVIAMADRWLEEFAAPEVHPTQWAENPIFYPPLGLESSIIFSPLIRPFRRLVKRVIRLKKVIYTSSNYTEMQK